MSQSPEEVCNDVLDDLGTHTIQSFQENTKNAKVCNRQYPRALKELLSATDWRFARKRAALTKTTSTRGADWYAYVLPNDFVRPVKLIVDRSAQPGGVFYRADLEPDVPYEIEGDVYYARVDGVVLEYVYLSPPLHTWPEPVMKALRAGIAAKISYPIKKDSNERTRLQGEYELFRDRAVAWELNTQPSTYGHQMPMVMTNEEIDGFDL